MLRPSARGDRRSISEKRRGEEKGEGGGRTQEAKQSPSARPSVRPRPSAAAVVVRCRTARRFACACAA